MDKDSFYKLIIAGSRGWTDSVTLDRAIVLFIERYKVNKPLQIVSGTAQGADRLGEQYARNMGHDLVRMPAEWDKHGRSAGYKRNERMAEYADGAIILWDGESKGSMHMYNITKNHKLDYLLVAPSGVKGSPTNTEK